jgi:hypothetical protein
MADVFYKIIDHRFTHGSKIPDDPVLHRNITPAVAVLPTPDSVPEYAGVWDGPISRLCRNCGHPRTVDC